MNRRNQAPAIIFGLLCCIWGSTWLAIKIGLEDSPPFLSAGFRLVLAGIILAVIVKLRRLSLSHSARAWWLIILSGVLLGLGYGAVYFGEQFVPAGLTAVLFGTLPLFVVLISHFAIPQERLNAAKIGGIVLGLLGILIIASDNHELGALKWWACLVLLFGSAAQAWSSVIIKKDLSTVNPVLLTAVQVLVGAVILLLIGGIWENVGDFRITGRSIGALFYLSLVGTVVAFVLYYWLMQRISVTRVSLIVLITPVVALILGWLLLGETVNVRMITGSVLVLGGVTLALRA